MKTTLETDRLVLRKWRESDREPFASMNTNEAVMRFFPRHYTSEESNNFIDANQRLLHERGWANWAVEIAHSGHFAGFTGLSHPAPWHPCAGSVEIGWRLHNDYWGRGIATEAATRVLAYGFNDVGLKEIISFTAHCNLPSIAVMKKLGMRQDTEGFEHPRIGEGSPLRSHVVYRLSKAQWEANQKRPEQKKSLR